MGLFCSASGCLLQIIHYHILVNNGLYFRLSHPKSFFFSVEKGQFTSCWSAEVNAAIHEHHGLLCYRWCPLNSAILLWASELYMRLSWGDNVWVKSVTLPSHFLKCSFTLLVLLRFYWPNEERAQAWQENCQ